MKLPLLYKDRRQEADTPVRAAQLVELHLAEVFRAICDRHGLKYWLACGTLLGALRHQGPIPWDDDFDVMILEPDYRKFLEFAASELPDDVYLETPDKNLRMENHITRLRDAYSWGLVRRDKRLLVNDHNGICIDIFPVRECGRRCRLTKWLLRRLSSAYGWYKRAHFNDVTVTNVLVKWCLGLKVLTLKLGFETTQLFCRKDHYVMASWFLNDRMWWPKEWIVRPGKESRMARFDNADFPVPFESEAVLEMQYGNWRNLPPCEERKGYLSVCLPTTPCFHSKAMQWEVG